MGSVTDRHRRTVGRLAAGLLILFAMASYALAEESYGSCKSYALETSDFRGIPAATSICNDVGLDCLNIDPSKEVALSSPIPYIDYDRQKINLPAPPLPKTAPCAGPLLAYTEIRPEDAIDFDKLTSPQNMRLNWLLPHWVNDDEWDLVRTIQHMTFQSPTDPDFSAEGLCYTEGTRFAHGTARGCAIYQFRKSGHVFAISVVGSRWDPGMCVPDGGEDRLWARDFLKKAAGQVFGVVANSAFDQSISVNAFGIRSNGWGQGRETSEDQRATIELVIRNAHPAAKYGSSMWRKPSRSFTIEADIKAEQCHELGPRNWLWIRSHPDAKAEWQKKGRALIKKIESTLCDAYGFGKVNSEKSSERDDPYKKDVVDYHFDCTSGPRSSYVAP